MENVPWKQLSKMVATIVREAQQQEGWVPRKEREEKDVTYAKESTAQSSRRALSVNQGKRSTSSHHVSPIRVSSHGTPFYTEII